MGLYKTVLWSRSLSLSANYTCMRSTLSFVLSLFIYAGLSAQPANDDCSAAIVLNDIANWCSGTAAYSNSDATTSSEDKPRCFDNINGDVWFTFTSISTSLNIRVIGDLVDIYGITQFSQGSMREPKLALYHGNCGELVQLNCDQDDGDHVAELYSDQIVPKSTYYLRVSSRSPGTFQLCVSSFNLVPDPNSDCSTGVVLCDKSSFFVPNINGQGEDGNEVNTTCLDEENNSAWYKWVAGRSGSLGFVITPNNPGDDIDFAVYELPNGINDCGDKIELRCMASGANGESDQFGNNFDPDPFSEWDECTGPTGLRIGETDVSEAPGCNTGSDNNFVSAIEMEEGKSYALVVLNFSATGHGFSLDFGGTGEFLGPQADFSTDDSDGTICFGDPVIFFDESSFGNLRINSWEWNFGENAAPQNATGPGPHQVRYHGGGVKSIALTVESETGCLVTNIGSLIVEEPFDIQADLAHQSCPEIVDGSITLDVSSSSAITSLIWNNGGVGRGISNLSPGIYEVTITNFNGCDTTLQYEIEAPTPLVIEDVTTHPSCGGAADGSIALTVMGQAPPFLYDFGDGGGFTLSSVRTGLVAGVYHIMIQDNNGCITELRILLGEINVDIESNYAPITPPSCFGYDDGRIEVRIKGGDVGYAFDWDIDGSYTPNRFHAPVGAGPTLLRIRDRQNCVGFLAFDVDEPDPLTINLDTTDISCFAATDGLITPHIAGGSGGYRYIWSHGVTDSLATGLDMGDYQLTVQDANGCEATASAFVDEPPELGIRIDSIRDVVCFGDRTGVIYTSAFGGSAPFSFSINGGGFNDNPTFHNLASGTYTVTLKDDRGCTINEDVQIQQPVELVVEAGPDTTIDLGFFTQLLATHQPLDRPVSYLWSPAPLDCSDCPSPAVRPVQTTTYQVMIIDDDRCVAIDSVTVFVFLNRPIYIPNAITPNSDGYNDRLAVYGGRAVAPNGVKKLQVFDRWGAMVWQGTNLDPNNENVGWDGTFNGSPLNPGVFVYVAEVQFIDNSILTFEGDITLIR